MDPTRLPNAVTLILVLLSGCGKSTSPAMPTRLERGSSIPDIVRSALEDGQDFELYSLDPKHRDEQQPWESLRRKVIGKTLIQDAAFRKKILAAFDAGVREKVVMNKCFDPRHAIRVRHGGKTYYITICFECAGVFVFVDDHVDTNLCVSTSKTPKPVFDDILRAAEVPLAEDDYLHDELAPRPTK